MLFVEIFVFGFALWLGAYLVNRNPADLRLDLAGTGLIAYSIALALGILARNAGNQESASVLLLWQKPFLILPTVCWLLLLLHLMRSDESWYSRLQNHKNPFVVVLIATIFFGLGIGLLLFQFDWIPRNWLLLAIGMDLLLLGGAVAFLDASDEGESLSPHFTRSLGYALFVSLIFGGQIAIAMFLSTDVTFSMLTLLISIVAAAILFQTFSGKIQNLLDRLILRQSAQEYQNQATLRETANAAPRQNDALDLAGLDELGFMRLTRRALSHMINLPRLSTSPLTRLPIVENRLHESGSARDTLERATELRAVLSESIDRLRPEKQNSFGTTDQWRHFNALYYPYVVGLKPYSRRLQQTKSENSLKEVLDWFRTQVPQRTLYNWQNEAARLVAQDLREQSWPKDNQKSF